MISMVKSINKAALNKDKKKKILKRAPHLPNAQSLGAFVLPLLVIRRGPPPPYPIPLATLSASGSCCLPCDRSQHSRSCDKNQNTRSR